jgi:hypothetical protein
MNRYILRRQKMKVLIEPGSMKLWPGKRGWIDLGEARLCIVESVEPTTGFVEGRDLMCLITKVMRQNGALVFDLPDEGEPE